MTTITGHATFLRRALRRPALLGAPAPTGTTLARVAAALVSNTAPTTVVELGAGTGAMSPAIRARLVPDSRYVAVEVDADLVAYLHTALPWLEVLHGDAADLGKLLANAGVGPVDTVVSSLPWTLISPADRRGMLSEIAGTLAPGGTFTTITTLTALPNRVREFRSELAETFDEVVATAAVWRNLPPARLMVCRGPRGDRARSC